MDCVVSTSISWSIWQFKRICCWYSLRIFQSNWRIFGTLFKTIIFINPKFSGGLYASAYSAQYFQILLWCGRFFGNTSSNKHFWLNRRFRNAGRSIQTTFLLSCLLWASRIRFLKYIFGRLRRSFMRIQRRCLYMKGFLTGERPALCKTAWICSKCALSRHLVRVKLSRGAHFILSLSTSALRERTTLAVAFFSMLRLHYLIFSRPVEYLRSGYTAMAGG